MRHLFVVACLSLTAGMVSASDEAKNIHGGTLESRVNALASIQPGLGGVMHEIGYRFSSMYWAANGGNWGLAQYQLKELLEAQEVAEITRPNRAPMLKAFENGYLVPLSKTIEKKDLAQFKQSFTSAANGCNGCHTALGYGFIRYRLPTQNRHEVLDFNLKTEPKYDESQEKR